jgi:hypothetical protein
MHCEAVGREMINLNSLECIEDASDSPERAALGINVAMVDAGRMLHAKVAMFFRYRVGILASTSWSQ